MEECSCTNCNHSLCAKKVPIFSFLSDDELRKVVDMTVHKVYKKGRYGELYWSHKRNYK